MTTEQMAVLEEKQKAWKAQEALEEVTEMYEADLSSAYTAVNRLSSARNIWSRRALNYKAALLAVLHATTLRVAQEVADDALRPVVTVIPQPEDES